jgi:pyruvate dehydrogenase E2 component (dihydrolipoamide acetyltransferase)
MVVESDKADMDVESFEDGYIAEILVPEGGSAPVGSTCARLVANLADIDKVSDSTPVTSVAVSVDPAGVVAPAMPSETSKPSVPYKEIFMPALSSTMIDGKIVTWTKKIGDKVAARETVMVVESDKADMDVEAFEDGILAAIITGEGESAPIGSTVGLLASKPDDMAALQAYAAQLKSATVPAASAPTADVPTEVSTPLTTQAPPVNTAPLTNRGRISVTGYAKRLASEAGINLQTVRGSGPSGRIVASDVENAVKSGTVSGATLATQSTYTPAAGVLAATPSARALANQHNVDLGSIKGTGNFGRVTADDVRAAVGLPPLKKETEAVPAKEAITVTAKSASPSGKDSAKTASSPEEIVAMDGMQKAVVKNMVATLSVPVFRVSRAIVTDKFDELYKVACVHAS